MKIIFGAAASRARCAGVINMLNMKIVIKLIHVLFFYTAIVEPRAAQLKVRM